MSEPTDQASSPESDPVAPAPEASPVREILSRMLASGIAGLILGLPLTAAVDAVGAFAANAPASQLVAMFFILEFLMFVPAALVPLPTLILAPSGRPPAEFGRDIVVAAACGFLTGVVELVAVLESFYGACAARSFRFGWGVKGALFEFDRVLSAALHDTGSCEAILLGLGGATVSVAFLALLRRRGSRRTVQFFFSLAFTVPVNVVASGCTAFLPLVSANATAWAHVGCLSGLGLSLLLALGDAVYWGNVRLATRFAPRFVATD